VSETLFPTTRHASALTRLAYPAVTHAHKHTSPQAKTPTLTRKRRSHGDEAAFGMGRRQQVQQCRDDAELAEVIKDSLGCS